MKPSDFNVCAIIVTFNPDAEEFLQLSRRLNESSCDFIVIDNASTNFDQFSDQAGALNRCIEVRRLDRNVGLASALNLGLITVREKGYLYAFLFDQDSGIGPTFCEDMIASWIEAQRLLKPPLAALGPRLQDPVTGRRTPFKVFGQWFDRSDVAVPGADGLFHAGFLITSGTLLRMDLLNAIGLMRDEFFIDNIDLDWCFRARHLGFSVCGTDRATLNHRVGVSSSKWLVQRGWVVLHSPLRTYYSTRNRLALYRDPHAPWDWKLRDAFRFVLKISYLVVFTPQRMEHLMNAVRGIRDAEKMKSQNNA